jgi:hypothetical protein
MQFIKANYFNSPPRTADELIALLLSLHDSSSTPIFPSNVVPGLSLHNTDGHGMLIKRSADHIFGKWGLKLPGRWATLEEAAADPRLLIRPPTQAADLPMYFSTGRKWYELPFSLAELRLEVYATACWQTPRNQGAVLPHRVVHNRLIEERVFEEGKREEECREGYSLILPLFSLLPLSLLFTGQYRRMRPAFGNTRPRESRKGDLK